MPQIIRPPKEALSQEGFAQITRKALWHPLWCQRPAAGLALLKLYDLGNGWSYTSDQKLAEKIDCSLNQLQKYLPLWRQSGLVRKNRHQLELYPFSDGQPLPEQDQPVKETIIAETLSELPRRKATGLTQQDRWQLFVQAWNKHKPKNYLEIRKFDLPQLIAVDEHTKHLNLDRDDYDSFVGAVLRGAGASDFWKSKEMGPKAVFGWSANLADQKFKNVKELYQAGKDIKVVRGIDSIAWNNDAEVLSLLPDQTYKGVKFERVDRIRISKDYETILFSALNYLQFGKLTAEQAKARVESQTSVKWRDRWSEPGTLVLLYPEGDSKIPREWILDETPREILNRK